MKHLRAIANTTDVNRYGIMCPAETLWSCVEQSWQGGLPSNLGHDRHQLIGWNLPLALYFIPGWTALVNSIEWATTKEEFERLRHLASQCLARLVNEQVRPHRGQLAERIGANLAEQARLSYPGCAAMQGDGLARTRFPALFAQADGDGLVPLAALTPFAPGLYRHDGLLVFAHPFLRRALSRFNTLNSPFLTAFEATDFPKHCDRRIALDADLLGLPETYLGQLEFSYWRGPLFRDDLGGIPTGVTCYAAPPVERMINGVSRTELGWYLQKGERIFECEELRNTETLGAGAGAFGCRYVHTILNERNLPVHADGAIRMYDEEKMLQRLETDIAKAGRKTVYTKLWRVDGELPVTLWKDLVSHYYRDNVMVGEYLGGVKEAEAVLEAPEEETPSPRSSLPLLLGDADGVHASANLHPNRKAAGRTTKVKLCPWDSVRSSEGRQRYYEADGLEVAKQLRVRGWRVTIPSDVERVDFRDSVFNLPSLLHSGPDAPAAAADTLDICREMFARWLAEGHDNAVTVSVGVEYEAATLWLSFAGTLAPMVAWLADPASAPPPSLDRAKRWCEQAHASLRKLFGEVQANRTLENVSHLLANSGVLRFGRLPVEGVQVEAGDTPDSVTFLGEPPKGEADEFIKRGYRPIPAVSIESSTCHACGREFSECRCSASQRGGGETVRRIEPFFVRWGRPSNSREPPGIVVRPRPTTSKRNACQ